MDKPIFGVGGDVLAVDDPHFNGDNVLPDSTARQIFDSKVIADLSISQMQDLIAFEAYEYWYEKKYSSKLPDVTELEEGDYL